MFQETPLKFASSKLKFRKRSGQKKEAINGCNQISEKTGSEKPLSDCKRRAVRLGGNRLRFQLRLGNWLK